MSVVAELDDEEPVVLLHLLQVLNHHVQHVLNVVTGKVDSVVFLVSNLIRRHVVARLCGVAGVLVQEELELLL